MDVKPRDAGRRTAAAVVAGVLLIVIGLAVTLAETKPRGTYSNQVSLDGPVAQVPPGAEVCQFDESVPADAPSVGIALDGRPGRFGPLELAIRDPQGRTVIASSVGPARLGREGFVSFDLRGRNPEMAVASFCLRNRGRVLVTLVGTPDPKIPAATPVLPSYGPLPEVDGQPQAGPFAISYGPRGERPAAALLPELVRRAGLVKGTIVGEWTVWLALLAAVGLAGTALHTVLRSEER